MKYLYEIVTDSSGNELGVTNYVSGIVIDEGVQYNTGFNGSYYPFTGDVNNPISSHPVTAQEGQYKLKMIVFDETGNAFTSFFPK